MDVSEVLMESSILLSASLVMYIGDFFRSNFGDVIL